MKFIDRIGDRYGRLTVIAQGGRANSGNALWLCQCDCGEVVTTTGSNLGTGNTRSCGCLSREPSVTRIDLTGQTFGRLTVIEYVETRGKIAHWRCACSCGGETVVNGSSLRRGLSMSCGCFRNESSAARGLANIAHGMSYTPTYRSWSSMKSRCTNPNSSSWRYYGGRGITVCDRWQTFDNFLADMGQRPPGMSIDRIDPNDGYRPGNCRWATPTEQANNRRQKVTP